MLVTTVGYRWSPIYISAFRRAVERMKGTHIHLVDVKAKNASTLIVRTVQRRGMVFSGYDRATRHIEVQYAIRSPRIVAPPVKTYGYFEHWRYGKARTSLWLERFKLGRYALRCYEPNETWTYPIVLKPKLGTNGRNVHVLTRPEDLPAVRKGLLFQQAVLNHTEWGIYFSAIQGNLLTANCMTFEFNASLFVRDKSAHGFQRMRKPPCPSELESMVRTLVKRVRYHGVGCGGVKYNESVPKILEINPRICGVMILDTPILMHHLRALADGLNRTTGA